MNTDLRFLIFVMDGLRPDLATPERMPNLHRLRRQRVTYRHARAAFPTETRVNQATLVTGCWPARHGLVANQFIAPDLSPDGPLNTGNVAALIEADKRSGGGILCVPDLGSMLHDAGGSLAVMGSGTTGGNRILHRTARQRGSLNMSLHGQEATATPEAAETVLRAIGPVPEEALPNNDRSRWLADAYMSEVAPRLDPTVTILWFSDPDSTYHYRGLGSEAAATAMTEVDRQLGRILDWREASGRADSLNIVALSDHGHVSVRGAPLDLAGRLSAAGLDDGISLAASSCGSLHADGATGLRDIVDWLQQQDWCGPLLSASPTPLPGTLPAADVNLQHVRTAPLTFVLAADREPGSGGVPGRTYHDNAAIPEGGSMHGGLTPFELSHMLALSGPSFGRNSVIERPAGLVDVMPTILGLLDIAVTHPLDGRPLSDSFRQPEASPHASAGETTVQNGNGFAVRFAWQQVGRQRFLDGAWRI